MDKKKSVLLIGDDGLDVYQVGPVRRISPEAPVPVMEFMEEYSKPGMAGNVNENLKALGLEVDYVHDQTSVKTRFVDHISGQQLLRLDKDQSCKPPLLPSLDYDLIVVSDYNKGTVTPELIEDLRKKFDGPILVDTKFQDLKRFQGCIVKINEKEYNRCTSYCDDLIVTLGGYGVRTKDVYYSVPNVNVFDVTGAGDTFLAALAYGMLNYENMEKRINFAIVASSITVQHQGVYSPTLREIQTNEHFSHRL